MVRRGTIGSGAPDPIVGPTSYHAGLRDVRPQPNDDPSLTLDRTEMPGVTEWEPNEWTAPTPTLFAAIALYRWVIAGVVVAAVVLGYLASQARPAVYEATNTVYLSDATMSGEPSSDVGRRVQQEAIRLESRSVFDAAVQRLQRGITGEQLAKRVSVDADTSTGIIEVAGNADDPDEAARIANAVVQAYAGLSRELVEERTASAAEVLTAQADQLTERAEELESQAASNPNDASAQQRLDAVRAQLLEIQSSISDLSANAALYGSGISDIEEAVSPREPSSPIPVRDTALVALLSLAVASAVAYWRAGSVVRARLDPSVVLGAPLLAQIPEVRRVHGRGSADPLFDAEAAEAYQFLLSSFEYAMARSGARSILVTSPSPGDGKSSTALQLARALAVQGNDVILVDADIRAHGMTTLLKAEGRSGLVSLAEGEDLDKVVRRYRISESVQLSIIPAGPTPSHPTGLLATAKYRDAVRRIIDNTALTIIDSAPLLTVADASTLASHVDAILLVLDAGISEEDVLRLQGRLRLIATPLLGYVVNRVPDVGSTSYVYGMAEPSRIRRLFGPNGAARDPATVGSAGPASGAKQD